MNYIPKKTHNATDDKFQYLNVLPLSNLQALVSMYFWNRLKIMK